MISMLRILKGYFSFILPNLIKCENTLLRLMAHLQEEYAHPLK